MDSNIQEYYELVRRFCIFVEGLVISRERVEELMSLLLQLYEKALHLPDTDPEDIDIDSNEEMTVLPLKIQIREFYWDVFDPFDEADEDKLVCGMVFDDLNDIYRDLKKGITAYELGAINEAVWLWKFGVDNH